jgi:ubiquinone/menaquinone biosynthesis C-methylase UbiE
VHQEKHLQEQYYAQTAASYDTMHSTEWNEHSVALEHVKRICLQLGLKSVLDVGCGTGAAVRTLLDCGFQAMGVEPVRALIDIGVQSRKLAEDQVLQGSAEGLGFPDRSFDAVCEFAVLHHIKNPKPAVQEMMRVSKHAVFISDENRFGRGPAWWRLTKLLWWKLGIFPLGFWFMTKGRGYNVSKDDGISYSYSVYDSYRALQEWADVVFFVPLKRPDGPLYAHPLLSTSHILLCAIRHPRVFVA